jgi:ABC-type branched-subunit amino acid transport system substrate-binding protein
VTRLIDSPQPAEVSTSPSLFERCVGARTLAALVSALTLLGCDSDEDADDKNAVVLGALLPYTGKSAGLGGNIEKSLLSLRDTINAAGGLLGRKLAIDSHDTHADLDRGVRETQSLLTRENLLGVIGPEDPKLAVDIASLIQEKRVIQFLPGNASPRISDPDGADLWFRTSPSAAAVAGALVEKMRSDSVERLLILFEPDAYGAEMNRLIACQFQAAGGTWSESTPLVGSISTIVSELTFGTQDAIALITHPETGARVVVDQTLFGARPARWYLAPTLDSTEFVRNVLPGSLNSATGIAPALEEYFVNFSAQYRARWSDSPVTTSYYYYDSAAIWALAVEAAGLAEGGSPSAQGIGQKLREVSSPPGELINWDNLAHGLQLVRTGVDIDYQGVTGALDIGTNGEARQNILRFWQVSDGTIQYAAASDYSQTLAPQCL